MAGLYPAGRRFDPCLAHMETAKEQIERCVAAARAAGAPREQVRRFLEAGYVPLPWQWYFHAAAREADQEGGPVDIAAGGARGPGKSHAELSQVALDDCQRVEGLKCLFLRQTGVSAKESFDDLVNKVVRGHVRMERKNNQLVFPNGSQVILGGFRTEKDIDKYVGIEYDVIIVEELTQLTAEKYQKLRGSLRTSKPNWRPRMYTSFNAGGIGHAFVKQRYVEPYRAGRQQETRFVPSTYKDNPYLNSTYLDYLEGLQGDLGRAWREGDWDMMAGQFFTEFSYDEHVVDPFKIPDAWRRYRSIDPSGRDGITSCHWYAVDNDGRVWVYREYYWRTKDDEGNKIADGRDYDEHAEAIVKLSEIEKDLEVYEQYQYTVIDSAIFAKAGFSETGAQIFERNGVTGLIAADKGRVVGWNVVHQFLRHKMGDDGRYQHAKLRIFSTCVNLIRTIPLAQHDKLNAEDVDTDGEDHAIDELRYFLQTLRGIKSSKQMNAVERRIKEINEMSDDMGFDYSRG